MPEWKKEAERKERKDTAAAGALSLSLPLAVHDSLGISRGRFSQERPQLILHFWSGRSKIKENKQQGV